MGWFNHQLDPAIVDVNHFDPHFDPFRQASHGC